MKINDLLVINEAGARSAAQQASMQAAASGVNPPNNPFGLRVVQGGPDAANQVGQAPQQAQPGKLAQVGQALKKGAGALAKGAVAGTKAVAKAAPGAISTVGDIGASAVKGVGDIASQAVGGATQAVGAGLGGIMHGYKAARSGQRFGGGGAAGTPTAPSTAASTATAPQAAGQDELDQLKSMLQTMDQRLRKAGI